MIKLGSLDDSQNDNNNRESYDYIVIGSGAGGGPLACKLALEGYRVLLLEAGGDDEPIDYKVPAFHARASENEALRWDYFVRHYADKIQQARDHKFLQEQDGVLYPRSGTLGGCTAHNAMILMYPHNSDWDYIAEIMGDSTWDSRNMRKYFQRLERCEYASRWKIWSLHGFDGWLPVNRAETKMLKKDKVLKKLTCAALKESVIESWRTIANPLKRIFNIILKFRARLDPNDWLLIRKNSGGLFIIPITTQRGRRMGSREYILQTLEQCPDNLVLKTHSLVQRILLDKDNKAYGVEYVEGPHQYRADPQHRKAIVSEVKTAYVQKEVIISAGAFNTPQLLQLSGIGPKLELEKHDIKVKVDLPGVGENLQDRYEIGVVTSLKEDIPLIRGMKLRPPELGEESDPQYTLWLQDAGPYTTNGATIALIKRAFYQHSSDDPDILIFGLLGDFRGYYPGYSEDIGKKENIFTWAILKAHTNNRGNVTLQSKDPRDTPKINFKYFLEHPDDKGKDLESMMNGIKTVRNIIRHSGDLIEEEIYPGEKIKSEDEIRQFIKDQAWGHHASGTCKMGPKSDKMAVVDNRFRVYGTSNLRIVDASIFPRIPGFFIVSSVYMISEKASELIIDDSRKATSPIS